MKKQPTVKKKSIFPPKRWHRWPQEQGSGEEAVLPIQQVTRLPIHATARVLRQRLLLKQQRQMGNRHVQRQALQIKQNQDAPARVQRFSWSDLVRQTKTFFEEFIPFKMPVGRVREENALRRLYEYALLHGDKGPLKDDSGFQARLITAIYRLRDEMVEAESFEKMPSRLKAIVFSAEQLNLEPIEVLNVSPENRAWMKTTDDGSVQGGVNKKRSGGAATFGEGAWKCNKLVADAYASDEGAGIHKKYPFYGDGDWGYKANDLASGEKIKHFPHSELIKLAEDGKTIVEIEEYDEKGKVVAKYKLEGRVFTKYEMINDKWEKTIETKNPDELEPGAFAQAGDIVAFNNIERRADGRRESGHAGLNLGEDLFISALNITQGIGILSIRDHLNPDPDGDPATADGWDKYNQVSFISFGQ